MKVALIPPIHQLPRYGALTDLHLVLAHLVIQEPAYREYYRQRREAKDYIILDNGAYELGQSVSVDKIMQAADMLGGVDEIMVPDAYRDRNKTMKLAVEFHEMLREIPNVEGAPSFKVTLIPQGKDEEEWHQCLFEMRHHRYLRFDGIAVPKHLGEEGRYNAVIGCRALQDKYLHILGCNHITEARTFATFNHVRSMDTSLPFVATYQRLDLRHEEHVASEFQRPENYFTHHAQRYAVQPTTRNVLTFLVIARQIY